MSTYGATQSLHARNDDDDALNSVITPNYKQSICKQVKNVKKTYISYAF